MGADASELFHVKHQKRICSSRGRVPRLSRVEMNRPEAAVDSSPPYLAHSREPLVATGRAVMTTSTLRTISLVMNSRSTAQVATGRMMRRNRLMT